MKVLFSLSEATRKLEILGQQHLLQFWAQLAPEQQASLLEQIRVIDVDLFFQQKEQLQSTPAHLEPHSPFLDYALSGTNEDFTSGQKLISQGKVGCIILAGGQGTRLRFNGPKGMFPVTPIRKKTLFQLFAEKTIAASRLANHPLKIAIMASAQNINDTQSHFKMNANFGLQEEQLSFFLQGELPLLDEDGNLFLTNPYTIAFGPDGNGSCLPNFVTSGLWDNWKQDGIELVNVILIDNALGDPFPAEIIGFHTRVAADVTVKCMVRASADEKVGVLVKSPKGVRVVEYSEMQEDERKARDSKGVLIYQCANMSSFCFNMDFIKDVTTFSTIPWHLAHKSFPYVNKEGKELIPKSPNAWKFEEFIFDWLPYASSVSALLYPRHQSFAPLKNEIGEDNLESVQQALIHRDIAILEALSHSKVMASKIELAQEFYYPTLDLLKRWRNRPIQNEGYIEDL